MTSRRRGSCSAATHVRRREGGLVERRRENESDSEFSDDTELPGCCSFTAVSPSFPLLSFLPSFLPSFRLGSKCRVTPWFFILGTQLHPLPCHFRRRSSSSGRPRRRSGGRCERPPRRRGGGRGGMDRLCLSRRRGGASCGCCLAHAHTCNQ